MQTIPDPKTSAGVGPGSLVGRYKLADRLGVGGMGEVWRAWDGVLQRWVALKVVPEGSGDRSARLLVEARSAAALKHPNVVSVFDTGEADGFVYVSMDLVEGHTLRHYIGRAISPETHVAWLAQIASALAAAHAKGLVHRDVKPENVMIASDGTVRVLDFGIAKQFAVDAHAPTIDSNGPRTMLTGEGRVVGTPAYMAPEQLAGAPASPSWDQYAWGVLAYELVTGKHPRIDRLIAANGWPTPPASLVPVLPHLSETIARAMAPTPDQRFASMDEIVGRLGARGALSAPPAPMQPSVAHAVGQTMASPVRAIPGGETLESPIHPNAPVQKTSSRARWWILGALGLAIVASVPAFFWWRSRSEPKLAAPAMASAQPATSAAPAIASSTPVLTAASSPPIPTASTTVALSATHAKAPVGAPAKKPQVVLSGVPTLQYDQQAIDRVVTPFRASVQACVDQHPPKGSAFAIDLELWSLGNEVGKVRDVRVGESPALGACLYGIFGSVSFGPPKQPNIPPGAVFVHVTLQP